MTINGKFSDYSNRWLEFDECVSRRVPAIHLSRSIWKETIKSFRFDLNVEQPKTGCRRRRKFHCHFWTWNQPFVNRMLVSVIDLCVSINRSDFILFSKFRKRSKIMEIAWNSFSLKKIFTFTFPKNLDQNFQTTEAYRSLCTAYGILGRGPL